MAYEVYNVRVETLDGQNMGNARLFFGINHARGRSYYYSTLGIQEIQTQYRIDTGVTLDLNGLCAYSAQDPVNLNTAGPWSGMGPYLNHRFSLPTHTTALKYIFRTGSYIVIDPVVYRSSENDYYCMYRYYTKTGALVISGSINCRTWNFSYDIARACSTYCMPWKGFSEGNYYYFVGPQITGSTDPVGTSITISTSSTSKSLAEQFFSGLEPDDPNDPYPDDGDSDDDDGGDGVLPDDEPIDIPDIPDVSVTDTGFVTLYNPTLLQVRNLASYMWSGLFDIATFKKLFADPMDCIIGFNIVPVTVPSGTLTTVKVGNIDTGVEMPPVTNQWIKKSCGTLNLAPIHDSYMDFAPYTKWSIYLPYIGIQTLSADDVAHQSLTVEYIIDVLTCACVAFIKAGTHVLYQFAGTCGYTIPFTSESFSRVVGNLAQLAVSVGGSIATGGASAPLNVGVASSVMNNVTNNKPEVHRSGALGGSSGIMGIQTPYLIIEYPRLCKPKYQSKYLGYPSFITKTVGSVSGYTEWESIVLNGIPCTDEERRTIEDVLKGGAYV